MAAIRSRPQYLNCGICHNTLKPGKYVRHFADAILNFMFSSENRYTFISMSLKFLRLQLTISQLWFR